MGKIETLGRCAKAKVNQRETLDLEIMVTKMEINEQKNQGAEGHPS